IELFRTYHIPYNVYGGEEGSYVENYEELLARVRDEAAQYLDKKAADLKKLGITKVSCVTKEGLAADEIILLGQKTPDNLIAMCSHGRSGVKRWVLGSVAEAVVRHCGDPVLITRPL
ncbi:MAG TPA: universal stress protein, partial [Candidatus Binatia bacterium]|nr:universal stress protein [Candidatus Binatia bacterium]